MSKIHKIKEAIISASIIIIITSLISFIPLKNEFLRAIRQDVYGFDIYDIYYSGKNVKNHTRDPNIILVEIADERGEIADQINIIQACDPAVIGIDAIFENKKDTAEDSKFVGSLKNADNIVFASLLESEDDKQNLKHSFFAENFKNRSGHINFLGDSYSVIRTYPPFLEINGTKEPAFSSRIIQLYSADKFEKLEKRAHGLEIINYTGNTPDTYTGITKEELTEYSAKNQLNALFKGRIVLLGYFIKYQPMVLNDIHFTPLNPQLAGKGFPDMYGVTIHANILTMILNEDYARLASNRTAYLIAFFITFLFLWYIIQLHSKKAHPSHGKILLFQFLLILFVLYFFLQIFNLFLLKIPLVPLLISLVLCVELLGLYKMLALWLHKKTGYKTVFTHK